MEHWLMLQDYTALNTMYRKTPQKQTTLMSPKGTDKQIDYILTKRRCLRYNKDAEANDMVHVGSDHRCVMATFTITTPEKSSRYKTIKGKHDIIKHEGMDQPGKNIEVEKLELEKDTMRSSKICLSKKNAATKKQKRKQAKCRSTSKK